MAAKGTRPRLLLALFLGASTLALTPIAYAGQLVAVDAVNGVETGFQKDAGGPGNDLSQFAGVLSGQLPGAFTVDVFHAPNPTTIGASAAVTGGTLAVNNFFAGTALSGSITGGSVTLTAEDRGCGKQRFRVNVQLADFTGTANGSAVAGGTGTAAVWLTHYRAFVFTPAGLRCVTLIGTISGIPPEGGATFTLTTLT